MLPALAIGLMVGGSVLGAATPALAQDEDAADRYARILQQIDDTRTSIARSEVMLQTQEGRIASLREQGERLPSAAAEVQPVLTRFVAELESVIENDIPFQLGERFERLNTLRELVENEDALLGEKVARALAVANIEATYGYEVASYQGDHPIDPRRRYTACEADLDSAGCALSDDLRSDIDRGASLPELDTRILDGDYVRYGRLSLAYVDLGTNDVLVFDPAAREWREAAGSEIAGIRRNLRVARGEAAPDVVQAPVVKN